MPASFDWFDAVHPERSRRAHHKYAQDKQSFPFAYAKRKHGFTLVELLVVITIIAILATIGMAIFTGVQKSARISATQEELRRLQQAMRLYKVQVGELPPIGDSCPACIPDNTARADVMRSGPLTTLASTAGGGPYISNIEDFVFDAWGIAYWYDDNDEGFSPGPGPCQGGAFTLNSPLYSSGPDTLNGTADDIHFDISCP